MKWPWNELRDIPNQVGFRFLGLRWDGTLQPCTVILRDGLHSIAEGPITDYKGWYTIPKARSNDERS